MILRAVRALLLGLSGALGAAEPGLPPDAARLIGPSCMACHDADTAKGGIVLEGSAALPLAAHQELWRKALLRLRSGEMPPPAKPRPPQAELIAGIAALSHELARAEEAARGEAAGGLRLLSGEEYLATLRDLLGFGWVPGSWSFPAPRVPKEAFSTHWRAQEASPELLLAQVEAAMAAVDQALAPIPASTLRRIDCGQAIAPLYAQAQAQAAAALADWEAKGAKGQRPAGPSVSGGWMGGVPLLPGRVGLALPLSYGTPDKPRRYLARHIWAWKGGAWRTLHIAEAGWYRVGLRGRASLIDPRLPEPRAALYHEFQQRRIPLVTTGLGAEPREVWRRVWLEPSIGGQDGSQFSLDVSHDAPLPLLATLPARPPGPVDLAVDPSVEIEWVSLEGPLSAEAPAPTWGEASSAPAGRSPAYARLLGPAAGEAIDDASATAALLRFAAAAFRREPSAADRAAVLGAYQARRRAGKDPAAALRDGLCAVLVDPACLGIDHGPARRLDGAGLATRLAYFLWRSTPDQELLRSLAGAASKEAALRREVDRLIDDERFEAFIADFADQWLGVSGIAGHPPSDPRYDPSLERSMIEEIRCILRGWLRGNRPFAELIDARGAWVDDRLALHYGIAGVQGSDFRWVEVGDGRRGGLLTSAALMRLGSGADTPNPVKRGVLVLERILGTPPPAPPPDIPSLERIPVTAAATWRERFEQHRAQSSCAACHSRIDPLGFAFEHYDALGAWRELAPRLDDPQRSSPVDASSRLPDGTRLMGAADLRRLLAEGQRLDLAAHHIIGRLVSFAVGRELGEADRPALDELVALARTPGRGGRDLLRALAAHPIMSLR